MAELQVKDIENGNILPTDKVYAFSEDESKTLTVDALVKSTPGIIALGVCSSNANTTYKQVTSSNWKGVPGESILIEFAETNSANAVYISINEGTALPVYPLNSNVIAAGSVIHSGAMLFTLSSDGTKLWAIVIALKTFDNQELAGSGNIDLGYYLNPIVNSIPTKVSDLQNDTGFVSSVPTKVSDLENDTGFITSSGTSAACSGNAATATKLQTARKTYVKLGTASKSETKDFSGDTAIPVNGTLGTGNGGTGATSILGILQNLQNSVTGASAGNVQNNYGIYVKASKFTTTSGCIKFSNGIIMQWGSLSADTSSRNNDVSFPVFAFTQTPIVILGARRSGGRRESAGFVAPYNISNTGFTASYGEYAASTYINGYQWVAIGY